MYHKDVLPNGVTIVSEEMPGVQSVAVGFWVRTGSRFEKPEEMGISHIIEHLLFKGTKKRTAKEIAESIESVGGQLNAFTSKEYTCYYARVLSEYLPLAIDVLTDMLFSSLFKEEDLEREKKVIEEEIRMYEDTPDEIVHDLFSQTIWGGHPLGRPVIGTRDSLAGITREDIISYYQRHYCSSNLVVALAGRVEHGKALSLLEPLLATLPGKGCENELNPPSANAAFKNIYRDLEQVQICLGVPGVSMHDPQIYTLQVLNSILGGGASSRLFQRIREERALVYSIYSYYLSYMDSGLFTIYAGTNPSNCQEVLDLSWEEIEKILEIGVDEEELERAKKQIRGSLLMASESVLHRMHRLGKSELIYRRFITSDDIIRRIAAVSRTDVQYLARQLFNPDLLTVTVLGPLEDGEISYPRLLLKT